MVFNTVERLMLLGSLPKEGDFTTLKIVRQLREDLSFTEAEHSVLKFETTADGVKWNLEGDIPRDFVIGEKATDIIISSLKKLDAEKRLTEAHLPLWDRFIK